MNTLTHTATPALRATAHRQLFIVANDPDERVLETVAEAGGYDVVIVEAMSHAYSKIKRVGPSLVVLCLEFEDLEAYQLMSMLKVDPETASIPVVTCLLEPVPAHPNV